jgi:hypothetical protein
LNVAEGAARIVPFTGVDLAPRDVAAQIDRTGSACLPSVVSREWLATARTFAERIAADGRHEVMLEDLDLAGPDFADELATSAPLRSFLADLARLAFPAGSPADRRVNCTMRVINGPDLDEHPLWFHFDATVVTMVIPVVIPDADRGQSGELVIAPKSRPHRRLAATNVVDKLVAQSPAYRRRFVRGLDPDRDLNIVALQPGSAYLFWGYRSYHATMPCAAGSTRATVIVHYQDVHQGSRLLRWAKAVYRRSRRL